MKNINSIAVFCGSRKGAAPGHAASAARFGELLAQQRIRLVYGAGNLGLMGVVANAVLDNGGEVTGVIPNFLSDLEVAHERLTELILVDTMHERKGHMFGAADAFVILPGGLGTLEEAMEIITWKQLRQHDKPIVLVSLDGFWEPLERLIDSVIEGGFAHHKAKNLYSVVGSVEDVFDAIASAPQTDEVVLTSHL